MGLIADVEATFVPERQALVLWGDGADTSAGERADLVLPAGQQMRRRSVPVEVMPIAAALDPLAALPAAAEVSDSVRAWSVATRLALDLIARGRVLPSIGDDGTDRWRVGPLDPDDHEHLSQLADALPPAAHARAVPDAKPLRVVAPASAIASFLDDVADALVRTAAASLASGFEAFATPEPHDVESQRDWLLSTTAGTTGSASARLRVDLPDEPDRPMQCVLEVQSHLDAGLVLAAVDLWSAPQAVLARFGSTVDLDLLVTLRRAARVWAPVGRLLDDARPDRLELDDDEVDELFGSIADDLAAAGLPVLWPAEVFAPIELRPVVTTPRPEAVAGSGLGLDQLGEMRWRATLDGDDLTDAELAALADAKRPMVRMRGRWVRADPTRLKKLSERRAVTTGEVLAAAITGTLTIAGEEVDAEIDGALVDLGARLAAFSPTRETSPPDDLDAVLRPYQQRGVTWLAEMAQLGLGGVLADDMGLGKTIQVLALHLLRRDHGPTLIVCPATLLGNWEHEANRFAPGVPVRRYHGSARQLDAVAPDELVVTTYGVVRRDAEALSAIGFDLVVADEAQAIKNPFSRSAKALRAIVANARIALTGTPVENRLSDLWALLDFTTPGLLGSLEAFQHHVAIPIERERDEHAAARLASVVRPFLLRRRKTDPDIAPDLPPKTETDHFVGLTTEQATLYRAVVAELLDDVAEAEGINRRGLVLKLLTALKQVCNHPAQYLDQAGPLVERSGKLEAVEDLVRIITDEGESVLIFTQFVAMGHLLGARLADLGIESQFLHGGVPVRQRDAMVARFQAGEPKVFVISLKAGGTGLNLTRATHVIHFDRWWNPAVEDQASDRAWRIGQDRPVQVHRMICEGTLEERIALMLETKRALAESVVGGGEAWISEMSDDELADLVALGDP